MMNALNGMGELRQRWLFALLAALLVAGTILFLGPAAVFVLALFCGLLAWREYARLVDLKRKSAFELWGYAWVLMAFTFSYFGGPHTLFWIWLAPLSAFSIVAAERLLVIWQVEGVSEESPEESWKLIQEFTVGCVYVFLLFGFVGPIAMKTQGQQLLVTAITAVALADTAAYFGGRRLGRRKLWPALSPGKTVEGACCSFLGSFLGAMLVWLIYHYTSVGRGFGFGSTLMIGFVAAPLGVLGDLFESLIKRVSGRKDSGQLIPGHGGILDRADAFVFVLPLIYFLF